MVILGHNFSKSADLIKPLQQGIVVVPRIGSVLGILMVTHMLVQPLWADELMNVSDFKECRVIKAKSERLLCYDTIADGGTFDKQKLQQVQVDNFGSTKKEIDVSVDSLTVSIVRIQKDTYDHLLFQTSDGQVWKQQNTRKFNLKAPFEAKIEPGSLGSFFLVTEDDNHQIRVKRVR